MVTVLLIPSNLLMKTVSGKNYFPLSMCSREDSELTTLTCFESWWDLVQYVDRFDVWLSFR